MALPGTLSAARAEWTPATAVSGGGSSAWHKRYVRNVTKGVSALFWGSGGAGAAHAKKSYDSPPRQAFRPVIDWSHATYPTPESIPTLDFHVARRVVIGRKLKSPPSPTSAAAPLLHPRLARTSFRLTSPLAAAPPLLETSARRLLGSHTRSASRWSRTGSSATAVSTNASAPVENLSRCVEALGVIRVLPFEVVRTDLYGEVTHRVKFVVTHLLHARFGEVLGIGEILVCATAAFTLAIYRTRDLQLMYDCPIHLAENVWLRYYKRHTRHATSMSLNDSRITALAVSPSSFSRRHGLIVAGCTSGLAHIWKVPERALVCVLPPPLSKRQAVVGVAFAAIDLIECIKDIASPFTRPETSETPLRRNYLLVFYLDGNCAMWSHSLSRLACDSQATDASVLEDDLTPRAGTIPTHLQFRFPSIEAPLRLTSAFQLEKLFQWHSPGEKLALEAVLDCGDSVALFVRVGERDFGFVLIHPQSSRLVQPVITFQDLGIPISVLQPAAACYALLADTHRCFIVATPGVIRIIEVVFADHGAVLDDTETHLTYELAGSLSLLTTLPVTRKTDFCRAKYDPDFDELLLGLTTGEVVKIVELSAQVLRS